MVTIMAEKVQKTVSIFISIQVIEQQKKWLKLKNSTCFTSFKKGNAVSVKI